jgi:hypothetical protein
MNRIAWTERNMAIVRALTKKVRFLSTRQIASAWWQETPAALATTERHLQRMQAAGFVEQVCVVAHPELPLTAPLFCWKPGEPPTDFGALTYQCARRWTGELRATPVWIATQKAADQFGGFIGGIQRPSQVSHDLHIGAICARLIKESPALAEGWVPEELLLRNLVERIPDAIIYDAQSVPQFALDFGGFGSRARLEGLHRVCNRWELPYAVW